MLKYFHSTCMAATLGIVTNVRYIESTDTTYTVSALALCSFAELVFIFAVVCVPSVPVVVKSLGESKIVASLKLWTRHSFRKTQPSRAYPLSGAPDQAPYEQVDEYSTKSLGNGQHDNYSHHHVSSGITLTTHVITVSEERDQNTATFGYQDQHLWDKYSHSPE